MSYTRLQRGDIYSAILSPAVGSEQKGSRPVLVIQNDIGNRYSSTVIVAAITSQFKTRKGFPTHYHLDAKCGLKKPSIIMLEQIRTIDKIRLGHYIGHLDDSEMERISQLLLLSLGIAQMPEVG